MTFFPRSNLKNWLPGALGVIAVFSLLAIAGISHNRASTETTQVASTSSPAAQGNAPARPAANTPAAPAKAAEAPAAKPAAGHEGNHAAAAPKAATAAQASAATTATATPPAAHDHAMAMAPAKTSAKTPPTRTAPSKMAQASPAPPPASSAGASNIEGDVVHGREVYKKCQACHSTQPGRNGLGPTLSGIVGSKAGDVPNYSFSTAMKQSGITWTPEKLDAYLADPQKVVPGNKMPFPGLKTEADRTDVIAFLAKANAAPAGTNQATAAPPAAAPAPAAQPPATAHTYVSDAKYTLRSGIAGGKMVFIGVGGTIDGKANPILTAVEGQVVQLTLINGEGAEHNIVFPDQDARSPRVLGKGASTTIVFRAGKAGDYLYYCDVPGHRLAGMEGQFLVTNTATPQTTVEADISRDPADMPPPIGKRDPKTVRLDLFTVEMEGRLAEGTTFGYWTFNGKVPGPMVRVRVGDTVDVHLKNSADSNMIHSVDFHAATGPGGGAAALQVDPGDEKSMTFKALKPGLYVYHCATPMVAEHIANGMYGMILVEPEEGLPKVDHEFYVMQGEIYTEAPYGQHGSQEFSVEKLLAERPEYFVFNGSVGAISKLHPMHAKVGDTVRIYFGVGGPNFTSSFHVIGEIFVKVYNLGTVPSPPLHDVQTVSVAPGGATITEFKLDVPGNYTVVDHALARMERGLVGQLIVEGEPNPDIYNGKLMPGMGH